MKIGLNKIYFSCIVLSLIILASYAIDGKIASFQPLAIAIIVLGLCFTTIERNFMILVMLIPYNDLILLGEHSVRGLIYVIATLKILGYYGKVESKKIFILSFILVSIEFVNDFVYTDIFSVLNTVSGLLYFSVFVMNSVYKKVDMNKVSDGFILSAMIAMLFSLIAGGGLLAYNDTISYNRFGEQARILGGAMGIPVYAGIIIAISLDRLFSNKCKMSFNIACILSSAMFGLLTVSRSFIMILSVILLFVLYRCIKKFSIKIIGTFFVMAVLMIIVYYQYQELINNLLLKFNRRMQVKNNIRLDIWKSCIQYLLIDMKTLLIGQGNMGYVYIGNVKNYMFYYMAHNLFLDAIMSWGLVGLGCLLGIIKYNLREVIFGEIIKCNAIILMPMAVFLVANLTEGSFNYAYTYVYILFVNVYAISRYQEVFWSGKDGSGMINKKIVFRSKIL